MVEAGGGDDGGLFIIGISKAARPDLQGKKPEQPFVTPLQHNIERITLYDAYDETKIQESTHVIIQYPSIKITNQQAFTREGPQNIQEVQ